MTVLTNLLRKGQNPFLFALIIMAVPIILGILAVAFIYIATPASVPVEEVVASANTASGFFSQIATYSFFGSLIFQWVRNYL